jgi:hypothetical protein
VRAVDVQDEADDSVLRVFIPYPLGPNYRTLLLSLLSGTPPVQNNRFQWLLGP